MDLEKCVLRDCSKDKQYFSNSTILASLLFFKWTANEDVKSLMNPLVACYTKEGSETKPVLIDIKSVSLALNCETNSSFWRREVLNCCCLDLAPSELHLKEVMQKL